MDIKKTIWFFFFFWGKVNLRTSTYIVYKSTAPANIKCGDFGTVLQNSSLSGRQIYSFCGMQQHLPPAIYPILLFFIID